MKLLILFHSKYGSAQQYAEWLRENLGHGQLANLKGFDDGQLDKFEQVVMVSSIYVGQVSAMGFISKHWKKLKVKSTYLLVVGNSPADSEESKQAYELIPENVRQGLKGYWKIPGKIDFKKIGFVYKLMLRFKGIRESEDKMDREALRPLVAQLGEIRL